MGLADNLARRLGSRAASSSTLIPSGLEARGRAGGANRVALNPQDTLDIFNRRATIPANAQGPLASGYVTGSQAQSTANRNLENRTGTSLRSATTPVSTTPESTTTPVTGSGGSGGSRPVQATVPEQQPEFSLGPVQFTPSDPLPTPEPEPEPTPYDVYNDPVYQAALQAAQSQFNLEAIGAQGARDYQKTGIQGELDLRPQTAEAARRRLAGNYASRGMGGGRAGALTRAEAEMNAREIAARTSLREQMAELDRQFASNYGDFGSEGYDWLGTLRGQQAQQAAIEQALTTRLGGLTTV